MAKRHHLPTRGFGGEPPLPDPGVLAGWVTGRRGTAGDIISYLLGQSLAPQIDAGVTLPCAGGKFYRDRVMESLVGIEKHTVICELGVSPDLVISDAHEIAGMVRGAWSALPAPHALGISDSYYHDKDEWSDAFTGAYRALMRTMRDAGAGGHVLICESVDEAELEALARAKVFFFAPFAGREHLETLLEHQHRIAAGRDQLDTVFDLASRFELRQLILLDPDEECIARSLTHLDPDRVAVGGYCTASCETYWKDLAQGAFSTV